MKEETEDEELPFFFNRRKDFEQKTAEHWQRIACRLKKEAKFNADQARCEDSGFLSNNDSDYE